MPRFILTRFGAIPDDESDCPRQPDIELPNWLACAILVIVTPILFWIILKGCEHTESVGVL